MDVIGPPLQAVHDHANEMKITAKIKVYPFLKIWTVPS